MIHLLDSIRSAPGQKAFEWKARREAQGTAQPWQPPQFSPAPSASAGPPAPSGPSTCMCAPTAANTSPSAAITA